MQDKNSDNKLTFMLKEHISTGTRIDAPRNDHSRKRLDSNVVFIVTGTPAAFKRKLPAIVPRRTPITRIT